MSRRFLTLVYAAAALAVLSAPAFASKGQLSVFQHDEILRGSGEDERAEALDEIDALGVDVVKVLVNWRALAPAGNSKPDDFDGADPGDYASDAWAPYDSLVREARERGMRVLFALGGLAPDWASTKAPIAGSGRPSPGQFRKFVKAVGTRYSGSYVVGGWRERSRTGAARGPGHAAAASVAGGYRAGRDDGAASLALLRVERAEPRELAPPAARERAPLRAASLPAARQGREGRAVGQRARRATRC